MGKKFFKKFLLLSMAATLVFGSAVSASAATTSPAQGQQQQEQVKKAATVKNNGTKGNASKKSMKVSFKATDATKVVIQYRVAGKTKWSSKKVKATDTSATLTGLKANKLYEIRVAATGEDGKTVYSGTSRRYIVGDKASKITAKKKAAVIKWKKVKGATGYQIRYSTNKNMKDYKVVYVKGASKVSKTIKSLKSKKTYYVQVRPYKTYGGKKYLGIAIAKKSVKVK